MEIDAASGSSAVTVLVLVRHGETELNRERRVLGDLDPPLNEAGAAQASALASQLNRLLHKPTEIVSSPKRRAIETAEALSDAFNLPIRVEEQLRERSLSDFDNMEIRDLEARRRALQHMFRDVTQDWAGVETVEQDSDVSARALAAIDVSYHVDNTKIAVTHAGVIKSVFHTIFAIPPHRDGVLKVRNGGVLILRRARDFWALETLINPVVAH